MVMRIPRGYEVNRPQFVEICEGVRPTDSAAPREAYTGLPHVRVDKHHDDPIVLDAGTLVGYVSYTGSPALGKIVPAVLPDTTGVAEADVDLHIMGATNDWGIPDGTSGTVNVGNVKPMGVVSAPVYSFMLQAAYTNYTRNVNIPIVTDYVVMIPATNIEEHAIRAGDIVGLGSGDHYGIGKPATSTTNLLAGRYARHNSEWAFGAERAVGRCLKKIQIATSASAAGTTLRNDLSAITLTSEATAEFGQMEKVQTVPGLGLTGSGTKGIPASLLDATLDDASHSGTKSYWALVLLIRL